MKKLFDRLKGHPPRSTGGDSGSPDDSGFFSTMFLERSDELERHVSWAERAAQLGAKPADRTEGAQLLARLWGQDRHAAALGPHALLRIAEFMHFVQLPANAEVISQDEHGDYLLILLEGMVAVDRVQPWGGRARLAEARPGEMLGEMSLLDAGTRFSACTTLAPCLVAVLDAASLDRLVQQQPRLALALVTSLARRLSLRLRQVSARLSALLSRD
jgi:CRP-like cAMP-binding protein